MNALAGIRGPVKSVRAGDGQDDAELEDNGSQVALTPPDAELRERLLRWIDSPNIALEDDFDDSMLGAIGMRVSREYDIDENSRSEWLEKNKKAMDLAMQVAEQKQYPWPRASNIIYPLITTAAVQFAARAYPAIVAGRNVVKGVVVGSDQGTPMMGHNGGPPMGAPAGAPQLPPQAAPTPAGPGVLPNVPAPPVQWKTPPGEKRTRADRIGEHMSWQLLDEQTEWEPEMDTLLHVLPIVGCEFKKTFFDRDKSRNASLRVSAKNVVINYKAKSLDRAPRITELVEFYPLEIEELIASGTWREFSQATEPDADGDDDAPIQFLEQHRWLDLDNDGYREPYIVTVHKSSSQVVRIVARYDADGIKWNATKGRIQKIEPVQYYTKFDFLPNTEGGIYGIGFGQLLRPLNEAINTTLNMLVDSGHLANTQGGFIGKGLSMNAGSLRFQPGEYKTVNVPGNAVREAIVQLQFPGPSAVLMNLLTMLIEAGKEVAAVKDILTGEQPQGNTPATTTLAIIEQGLKVFSAIYKRIHRALKAEFDKLYRLNRIYLDEEASYKTGDDWKIITKQDYEKGSGVEPYSDPTMVSDMQRLGRAQFLEQFKDDPMCNGLEIRRRVFEAASIDHIDRILAGAPPPNPAILAKAMELHTKQTEAQAGAKRDEAQALNYLAQAIQALANADKTVGDAHIAWLDSYLRNMQAAMDGVPIPGAPGAASAPAMPPGGGPSMVPPPPISEAPRVPIPATVTPNQDVPLQGVGTDRDGHVFLGAAKADASQ